jgi:hypothetical protein
MDRTKLKNFSKDVLVDKIINLQEYILSLKDGNNNLINKINAFSSKFNELKKWEKMESVIKDMYPLFNKLLQIMGDKNRQKVSNAKGYCLVKRENKKNGFLYYVRYIVNGKEVPSKWNTYTNDLESAKIFAEENRFRILNEYYNKHPSNESGIKNYGTMYKILKDYYSKDSEYLKFYGRFNRTISEKYRIHYLNMVNRIFIPFLRRNKINNFNNLTPSVIGQFQFMLSEKGKSSESILRYLKALKTMFSNLIMMGLLEKNIFENITKMKVKSIKNIKMD